MADTVKVSKSFMKQEMKEPAHKAMAKKFTKKGSLKSISKKA